MTALPLSLLRSSCFFPGPRHLDTSKYRVSFGTIWPEGRGEPCPPESEPDPGDIDLRHASRYH